MKQYFVLFLIIFFTNCVSESSKNKNLKNTIDNPLEVKYDSTIKYFAKLKKYDSAKYYVKKILPIYIKSKDSIKIAKSHYRLGYYNKKMSMYEQSYYNYNEALFLYENLGDTIHATDMLRSMANIQKRIGDLSGSVVTATDGLRLLGNSMEIEKKLSLMHIISVCLKEQGEDQQALQWNNDIIHLLEKIRINEPLDSRIYKTTRANILANLGKYEESIGILSELLKDKFVRNSKTEYARVLDNYSRIKWLHNPSNTETLPAFLEALQIRKELHSASGLISSTIHLSKYYNEIDKSNALRYSLKALQYAKEIGNSLAILEALDLIIPLKKQLGLNLANEAELYGVTNKKVISTQQKIRSIYAVAKYRNDTLVRENLVLQAEASKKEKQIIIYIVVIAAILLGGFLITYFLKQRNLTLTRNAEFLKQKNKTEKLAAPLETEAQLARRVHDDFGAKLNHSMSLVQNNTDKEVVLDYLDALYNQSRDFSREINEVDTGENYKEELFQMFRAYTSNHKLYIVGSKDVEWTSINALNKTVLYKVLRELMINMDKHSKATAVTITFGTAPQLLKINYSDNGVGASKKELILKNGLRITENRIKAINGTIIFDSEKGKGFKAQIQIPN